MKKIHIALALVFFGICSALALGPFNSWAAGMIALFPLLYIIDHTRFNVRQTIMLGFLTTLSFNIFAAYWLFYTIIIYGHMHWSLAAVIFGLYTVLVSGRYVFFYLLVRLWRDLEHRKTIRENRWLRVFTWRYPALAFAWGFSEYFGWQLFHALEGNAAAGNRLFIQSADIFGIYGVGVFWFLLNLSIYDAFNILIKQKNKFQPDLILKNKSIMITAGIILLIHVYGFFAIDFWENKNRGYESVRVAVIQGNTPLAFERIRSVQEQIRSILVSLKEQTEQILDSEASNARKPDLVVWPEASVPFLSMQNPGIYSETIKSLQDKYRVPFIINDVYSERINDRNRYYNNLWVMGADGSKIDYYHKIQLLPFGEFIPLGETFPFVYDIVPEVSGFTSGRDRKTINLGGIPILPSICYELLPPQFTYNFFKRSGGDARLIVNITNDSWFGPTTEQPMHLMGSTIRAIELRLPIVRATNGGISGYIDVTGKVMEPTGSFVRESRLYDIPVPDRSRSIYSKIGLLPFHLFLMMGTVVWAFAAYAGYTRSNRRRVTEQ